MRSPQPPAGAGFGKRRRKVRFFPEPHQAAGVSERVQSRTSTKVDQLPGARFPMSKTDGFLLMRRSLAEPAPPPILPEGCELVPLSA